MKNIKVGDKIVYDNEGHTIHYIDVKIISVVKWDEGPMKMINEKFKYDCECFREPTPGELDCCDFI